MTQSFRARVQITLRPSILDPQGKAVHQAVGQLGYASVADVRIGKYAELLIDAASADEARRMAGEVAERLLANPVMEDYALTVEPA